VPELDDAVVSRLHALGLSLYEAKVYVGLLQHGPQNGNEVSKSARLPSSKVYSTLERLVSKGIVQSVRRGSTTQYVCISAGELLDRLRREFDEPLAYLERTLPLLSIFEPAAEVLTVLGLDAIRENGRFIVRDAREEIYVSVWADDVEFLGDELAAANERGVRIFGMLYGDDPPRDAGSWFSHSYRQIVSDRIGGRMLTLAVDGSEALIAHIPGSGVASAVRTRNPVLALITREYLQHDIVLQRAQSALGLDEWDRWWQGDPDLRTIILSQRKIDGRVGAGR
jgi:HTH-type transcriptional regulator, sugar sensing transcriptional regulator